MILFIIIYPILILLLLFIIIINIGPGLCYEILMEKVNEILSSFCGESSPELSTGRHTFSIYRCCYTVQQTGQSFLHSGRTRNPLRHPLKFQGRNNYNFMCVYFLMMAALFRGVGKEGWVPGKVQNLAIYLYEGFSASTLLESDQFLAQILLTIRCPIYIYMI